MGIVHFASTICCILYCFVGTVDRGMWYIYIFFCIYLSFHVFCGEYSLYGIAEWVVFNIHGCGRVLCFLW